MQTWNASFLWKQIRTVAYDVILHKIKACVLSLKKTFSFVLSMYIYPQNNKIPAF